MAKKAQKSEAAPRQRRAKRRRITPKLVNEVRASIVAAQKVVYAELGEEHRLGMGTLHKIVSTLEAKGVVGPGGKGKKRAVLIGRDGTPHPGTTQGAPVKAVETAASSAPRKGRRRGRGRRRRLNVDRVMRRTAPAEANGTGKSTVANEIALIRKIAGHFTPAEAEMLLNAAKRLEKLAKHSALLEHLSD